MLASVKHTFPGYHSIFRTHGPPTYDLEIGLASALMAVTFPFLIFLPEFFKFWPLAKSE